MGKIKTGMSKEEDNSLISEFVGVDIERWEQMTDYCHKHVWMFNDEYFDHDLEFDRSWDLLMSAVDKIEEDCSTDIHFYTALKGKETAYHMTILGYKNEYDRTYWDSTRIKVVYKSVVEYIKWLNDNNHEN